MNQPANPTEKSGARPERKVPIVPVPEASRPAMPPIADWTTAPEWTYPLIASPWSNHVYVLYDNAANLFWDSETGQTFILDHITPVTEYGLFGELSVMDLAKSDVHRRLDRHDMDIKDIVFRVFDIDRSDLDANQRAYQTVNLPQQHAGTEISPILQIGTQDALNEYLARWQDAGYAGALCRPLNTMLYSPYYSVANPL